METIPVLRVIEFVGISHSGGEPGRRKIGMYLIYSIKPVVAIPHKSSPGRVCLEGLDIGSSGRAATLRLSCLSGLSDVVPFLIFPLICQCIS